MLPLVIPLVPMVMQMVPLALPMIPMVPLGEPRTEPVSIFISIGYVRKYLSLERSDLSTVFNLQSAHRELVLCILPLILSMCSLKRSIIGKPVQFHGSIQIPQSNKHRKAPAVCGNTPFCTKTPFKSQLSGICYGK